MGIQVGKEKKRGGSPARLSRSVKKGKIKGQKGKKGLVPLQRRALEGYVSPKIGRGEGRRNANQRRGVFGGGNTTNLMGKGRGTNPLWVNERGVPGKLWGNKIISLVVGVLGGRERGESRR